MQHDTLHWKLIMMQSILPCDMGQVSSYLAIYIWFYAYMGNSKMSPLLSLYLTLDTSEPMALRNYIPDLQGTIVVECTMNHDEVDQKNLQC